MNREDIIRMARECGFWLDGANQAMPMWVIKQEELERFAALVASAEREKYEAIITNMTKLLEAQQNREGVAVDMIAAGIAAEREACAKVCEDAPEPDGADLAERIRARGQA